jgi:hypothetical protein
MAVSILRLSRTDGPKDRLLIHVSQQKSKSLSLKLVGTDQEHVFHAQVTDANVRSLQASNYSGDLEEWKSIIQYLLLHERPTQQTQSADIFDGLEIVSAISGKSLSITIRKNIGGITQRLGSIKLGQDDEREEVSPFDWVDTAVANGDELRNQLHQLQASISGQQDEMAKLNQQLDDLVQAKKQHEEELLKKFAVLLNEKKLKIRDQQRLLRGAKIDPAAAKTVRTARDGGSGRGRHAKQSGRGKRKANEADPEDGDEEEDDEQMQDAVEDEDEQRQDEETPQPSDEEATDDEDLDAVDPPPSTSKANDGKSQNSLSARELPFQRKENPSSSKAPVTRAATAQDDDDDDETDDEL